MVTRDEKCGCRLGRDPIHLEGFLALTERSGTLVGGVKMGSELCNCQETGDFVDYHLWIVKRGG